MHVYVSTEFAVVDVLLLLFFFYLTVNVEFHQKKLKYHGHPVEMVLQAAVVTLPSRTSVRHA